MNDRRSVRGLADEVIESRMLVFTAFSLTPRHLPTYPLHYANSSRNLSGATEILQRLTGLSPAGGTDAAGSMSGGTAAGAVAEDRKRAYLRAAVRVLGRNIPGAVVPQPGQVPCSSDDGGARRCRDALPPAPLEEMSVRVLLRELNDIVDPPRKLPRFKVHLRRAPTQEVSTLPVLCVVCPRLPRCISRSRRVILLLR